MSWDGHKFIMLPQQLRGLQRTSALHVRRAGHGHPIRSIRRALLVSVSVPPRARRQIAIPKHQMHRRQKKKAALTYSMPHLVFPAFVRSPGTVVLQAS
jgi:hypothetical protein